RRRRSRVPPRRSDRTRGVGRSRRPRLGGMMPKLDFRHAIHDALDEELARDERVVFFGEDVAVPGGVFATTPGLRDRHGDNRVFDTPISELALSGAAFGSAVCGLRPVI